ncbi:MAG: InlB B-repeat-containing protein [Treponema sp.]|nr:InlB B-repeat-containing protein [Treponema sp.]
MKTRIHGVFAVVAAVVLSTALLVTNCSGPFDLSGLTGKGSVLKEGITISIEAPRTIIPTAAGNAFTSYRVTITGISGTDDPDNYPRVVAFTSNVATLTDVPEGDYSITVDALIGAIVAATGTDPAVTHESPSSSITIPLAVIESGGTGLFTWNITLPTGADVPDTATIQIGAGAPISLLTGGNINTAGNSIASGMHEVTVKLTKAGCQDRIVTEVLYIFQGMTANYTYTIPKCNKNEYTVTYYYQDGRATPSTTATVAHLGTITVAPNPGTNFGDPGATFDGWFTAPSGGTLWTFPNSTKIYNDFALYAQWTASPPEPDLEITLTFTMPGDIISTITVTGTATISQEDVLGAEELSLSVNLGAITYTSIEWLYKGVDVGDGTATFIFNDDNDEYSIAGDHVFTLRVTVTGGKQYTKTVTITVTPSAMP